VESGEGLERRMTVDLSAEQFEAEVIKRLRQVARTARIAGFRPGKVPVKILRQRFGVSALPEIKRLLGDRYVRIKSLRTSQGEIFDLFRRKS
jgi:FKBP-type peptidyl-prolyl cis-trans isomerase (trigger factor)